MRGRHDDLVLAACKTLDLGQASGFVRLQRLQKHRSLHPQPQCQAAHLVICSIRLHEQAVHSMQQQYSMQQ